MIRSFAPPLLLIVVASAQECGLYLAPSSLNSNEDNIQWGLFAGSRPIQAGSEIGGGDVAVNLHNFRAHNTYSPANAEDDPDEAEFLSKMADMMTHVIWQPGVICADAELQDDNSAGALIANAGFLLQSHADATNAEFHAAKTCRNRRLATSDQVAGYAHVNRGATSSFPQATLVATNDISPGREILLNFVTDEEEGSDASKRALAEEEEEDESEDEEEDDDEDHSIQPDDYRRIDETVTQMLAFFTKHEANLESNHQERIYQFLTKDFMTAAVGPIKAKRVAALLPKSPSELRQVQQAGGIASYQQQREQSVRTPKSQTWLMENGWCADGIQAGPSTIRHAGRGAFARRAFDEGQVITASPVLLIPDKVSLNMYDLVSDNTHRSDATDAVRGKQLLLNYVYGHADSTLVMFPVGPGINLINHADEPNARLVWSNRANTTKLFQTSPHQLAANQADGNIELGLVLEVVASRQIAQGEEIFLDYGPAWKQAWEAHTRNWENRIKSGKQDLEWPWRAADFLRYHNNPQAPEPYDVTVLDEAMEGEDDEEDSPYPEHVSLAAFLYLDDEELAEDELGASLDEPLTWNEPESRMDLTTSELIMDIDIMDIEEEVEDEVLYTIRYTDPDTEEFVYVAGVPHEMMTVLDQPGTSDQFVKEGVFRHAMALPDDVFPQGPWRNLV